MQFKTANHRLRIPLSADWPQSQSYAAIDGQSVSMFSCQPLSRAQNQIFCYCQRVAGLLIWGPVLREDGCRLRLMQTLASAVILISESLITHDNILLSRIRDFPTGRARSPYL
jgi:hypothetical protein